MVPGWYTEAEARLLWHYASEVRASIVEVGCFCGRSTNVLAAASQYLVYAIDIFDGHKHRDDFYKRALKEMAGDDQNFFEAFRAFTLRGPWGHKVVATVASDLNFQWMNGAIGMLHLDHEHTAIAVESSLRHWWRWILPDGVVAIHDYFSSVDPDVRPGAEAVGMRVIDQVDSLAICQYPER